mmetsp:Transcript_7533/g.12091  ORF Transcript_7533/g.12091 Transcript_7533/m.12091 type:complete len:238 (-) Transcript_7533:43-756(-)
MPVSTSRHAGATKAAAALAIERPRHECLFPQLAQPTSPTPLPVAPRELSRCSRSEPLLASSFRKAASSRSRARLENSPHSFMPSALSAATTAFVVESHVGSSIEMASGSKAAHPRADIASRQGDSLEEAVVAATDHEASEKKRNELQAFLPYRASPASSLVSGWRAHFQAEAGKNTALARGLRVQDVRYGNANSPGVCVLRQADEVPTLPGISAAILSKQSILDSVAKQLLQLGERP